MNLSQKKNAAKEIKTLFKLILIACGINLVIYSGLSIILKPPVNPPVPEEVKSRLQYRNHGSITFIGDAFKTNSEYDKHLKLHDIIDDNINEVRISYYRRDVNEKFSDILPWIFAVVILGFYVLKGSKWVQFYSNDSTDLPSSINKGQGISFVEKSSINVSTRKSVPWICKYCSYENTINESSCEKCNRK